MANVHEEKRAGIQEATESKHPLANQLRGIRKKARTIVEKIGPHQQRDAELRFLEPSLDELGELVTDYEQFLTGVLTDTQLRQDLHPTYVRSIIMPRVELAMDRSRTRQAVRDDVREEMEELLEQRFDDNTQLRKATWDLVKKESGFDYYGSPEFVNFSDSPFKGEPDEAAIEQFVQQLAFEDIRAIEKAMLKSFPDLYRHTVRGKILEKMDPERGKGINYKQKRTFRESLYVEVDTQKDSTLLSDYVPWMQVFRESSLGEVFGQELTDQDQRVYRDILNRSVDDESAIELLAYFPTSEVISYLLIFAAGSHYDGFSVGAQDVLDLFAKRPDWQQLRATVQDSYQSLGENIEDWFPGNFEDDDRGNLLRYHGEDFFREFIAKNSEISPKDPRQIFFQKMVQRARENLPQFKW